MLPLMVFATVADTMGRGSMTVGGSTVGLGGQRKLDAPSEDGERLVQRARDLRQKQTSKDLRAALTLLQQSAQVFRRAGLSNRVAEVNLEIGEIHFILSRYTAALNAYRSGWQLAADDETRCRALVRMARTYSIMGWGTEAMQYSGRALSICEALPCRKARAEAYEARGEALYSLTDYSQAIQQFNRSLELFDKNDEGRPLSLLMLATAYYGEGKRDKGIGLAKEALQLWSSLGNGHGVAQAQAALGLFNVTSGQFESARCHCTEAQKIFERVGDEDHKAKVLNTLGYVSMQMGDPEAALQFWRQSKTAYAHARDRLGEASANSVMGMALMAMHRYKYLPPLFQEELRLAKQAENKSMEASALADIAGFEALNQQYVKAESHYLQSVEVYHSLGLQIAEGNILALLAEFYIKQHRYKEAISFLKQALTLVQRNNAIEDEARIQYDLAFVYRAQEHVEEANSSIQRAIEIIETQRGNISKFDSRASYFAAVHNYYALHIQLLMLRHRQGEQDGFAVRAFEASERSKVRSLIDWLAESDQGVSCDALLREQAEVASPDKRSQNGEIQTPSPVTLREAQLQIAGDDAVLLEYSLGDQKSYLWAVTDNQIVSYELPNAQRLKDLIQHVRDTVTARQRLRPETLVDHNAVVDYQRKIASNDQEYGRYISELSNVLLGRVPINAKKHIIFVPDGPLQYVPFAALLVRGKHGQRSILAADHEIVVLPSVAALAAIRRREENKPHPTLQAVVFANPVLEWHDSRVHQSAGAGNPEVPPCANRAWQDIHPGKSFPPITETHREAEAVKQYLGGPGKVFVAERYQASRKTLLSLNLGAYRLVHFATHGILDVRHPEESGLILSSVTDSGAPQDGCVRLSEINKWKLSADLVILSSCESALGKDLSSEGIIGLPRSFLRAGARSLIATLWEVDDAATADLMTRFYYHLHLGESPASALRNSQLDLWHGKQWSHEYYWAAFFLLGEYRISSLN
jgi:CHAT domain-containing protein/tetratricopeptide (TPR) repeat protein